MKKEYLIIVLSLLMHMSSHVYASNNSLYSGRILDGKTGEPVAGASVLLSWEQEEKNPMGSVFKLLDVQLVYTDERGNYEMTHDIGGSAKPTVENIIVYQPGYQAVILWGVRDGMLPGPRKYLETKVKITELQRIPPRFDHRKQYESIEDAVRAIDSAIERLNLNVLTGERVEVSSKEKERMNGYKKILQEISKRSRWEKRRYSPDEWASALADYCGILNADTRKLSLSDESNWEPKFLQQYDRCSDSVLKEMKSNDPWVQLDAVYRLGAIKARKTAPMLLSLLNDQGDWRHKYVQQESVLAIQRMGRQYVEIRQSGVPATSSTSAAINGKKKPTATRKITETRSPVIPIILKEHRDQAIRMLLQKADDPFLRKEVIYILGRLHAVEAEDIVMEALLDPDEEIRATAVTAHAFISNVAKKNGDGEEQPAGEREIGPYLRALKDPVANVRLNAVNALKHYESPLVVDAFCEAVRDPDDRIRSVAMKKLSGRGDIKTLKALAGVYSTDFRFVREELRGSLISVSRRSARGEVRICQNEAMRMVLKEGEEAKGCGAVSGRIDNPIAVGILIDTFGTVGLDAQREIILYLLPQFEDKRIRDFLLLRFKDNSKHVRACSASIAGKVFGPEVVPSLIIMTQDDYDEARAAALSSLSTYRDARLADVYLKALRDPANLVKHEAFKYIRRNPDKRAVEPLVGLLSEERYAIAAISTLAALKDERSVEPLAKIVMGTWYGSGRVADDRMRKEAVAALGWDGNKAAVPTLLQVLENKELEAAIIISLGAIRDRRAVPVLLKYAQGVDRPLKIAALQALVQINDPSLLDYWRNLLEDRDEDTRRIAVSAVGIMDGTVTLRMLVEMLDSHEEWRRKEAVQLLGKRRDRSAVRALVRQFGRRPFSFSDVNGALKSGQVEDISAILVECLDDEDPYLRRGATGLLAHYGDENAIRHLRTIKHDKLIIQADFAVWAIEQRQGLKSTSIRGAPFEPTKNVDRIKKDLASPDPMVRRNAVWSVSLLNDVTVNDAIIPLFADKNVFVRQSCAKAVFQLRNQKKAIGALVMLVSNREENDEVRVIAAAALGDMGANRAVDVLIAALDEEDAQASLRQEALWALKRMDGEKAVSALERIAKDSDEDTLKREALGALRAMKKNVQK